MTNKELMLSGELYIANDEELAKDSIKAKRLINLINTSTVEQKEYRIRLFRELLKNTGEDFWIEPPFYCDYGCHISIGENFYANFDCIILDVCKVTIGDNVFFGPRVCVYTACHPIDSEIRSTGLEFGKPVTIGNNVWVGGNSIIMPGVHIGDNIVIGAGSVVTKDIPSNVIAVGNPCKVLRPITEEDKKYWTKKAEMYHQLHNKSI